MCRYALVNLPIKRYFSLFSFMQGLQLGYSGILILTWNLFIFHIHVFLWARHHLFLAQYNNIQSFMRHGWKLKLSILIFSFTSVFFQKKREGYKSKQGSMLFWTICWHPVVIWSKIGFLYFYTRSSLLKTISSLQNLRNQAFIQRRSSMMSALIIKNNR